MANSDVESRRASLERVFEGMGRTAVAVSGGVDSMTLAVVAHRALGDIDASERLVRAATGAATVRCRVRRAAVVVELDNAALDALDALDALRRAELAGEIGECMTEAGVSRTLRFEPYRMDSAFLRRSDHA